jgi:hypothetical protein
MSEKDARRFTQDEVNEILRRAIDRQGGGGTVGTVSYNDLLDTARELGIDPHQLEAAMQEQEEQGSTEAAREAWKKQRKQKFFQHLRSFVIVNFGLLVLDIMTGGPNWFFWPLFGWGIGLAFDAAETFYPKERDIERGARRLLERQHRLRRRELKINGKKSLTIDSKGGRIIIEKGDKRIEIG